MTQKTWGSESFNDAAVNIEHSFSGIRRIVGRSFEVIGVDGVTPTTFVRTGESSVECASCLVGTIEFTDGYKKSRPSVAPCWLDIENAWDEEEESEEAEDEEDEDEEEDEDDDFYADDEEEFDEFEDDDDDDDDEDSDEEE